MCDVGHNCSPWCVCVCVCVRVCVRARVCAAQSHPSLRAFPGATHSSERALLSVGWTGVARRGGCMCECECAVYAGHFSICAKAPTTRPRSRVEPYILVSSRCSLHTHTRARAHTHTHFSCAQQAAVLPAPAGRGPPPTHLEPVVHGGAVHELDLGGGQLFTICIRYIYMMHSIRHIHIYRTAA